jgi:hypothetical protein
VIFALGFIAHFVATHFSRTRRSPQECPQPQSRPHPRTRGCGESSRRPAAHTLCRRSSSRRARHTCARQTATVRAARVGKVFINVGYLWSISKLDVVLVETTRFLVIFAAMRASIASSRTPSALFFAQVLLLRITEGTRWRGITQEDSSSKNRILSPAGTTSSTCALYLGEGAHEMEN